MNRFSFPALVVALLVGCNAATPQQTALDKPPHEELSMSEQTESDQTASNENSLEIVRSEEEWRKLLSPEAYRVLREKGTERPYVNKYDEHFEPGTYSCAACGGELFDSETKFNSGCGWPAFYAAKAGDRVKLTRDVSHGMVRTEVTCARCDSHLGHVFDDSPQTPTGQRFCINSVSLNFTPAPKEEKSEEKEP